MTTPTILVVAKAPVPGFAKTRLGKVVGDSAAADIAAASLLDTLDVVAQVGWPVVVAVTGDFDECSRGEEVRAALATTTVIEQRGKSFAERLVAAHNDADSGHGVVQIGMDTPQLAVADFLVTEKLLAQHEAVVGSAEDGGWWLLAVRSPIFVKLLGGVPMSVADTCRLTVEALENAGADVGRVRPLADIDTWDDALELAENKPQIRTSAAIAKAARP